MIPRTKVAPWAVSDLRTAAREGWNVFNSGTPNARIERDDSCTAFDSDDSVWEYLIEGAADGEDLARRALLHVAIHNPTEFALISKYIQESTV